MTTFDINARFGETASRPVRTNPVARWFAHWRHRRRQRLTLTELHRLNPYLLRDMGIEPQDVIDALEGRDISVLFNPVRTSD